MREDKSFLGKGWSFPPSFIKGIGVGMSADDEDIRQSLSILFSTTPGERIFNFEYGCNIRQWVFEKIDLSVKTLIIENIKKAVLFFEPRINVVKIDIEIKNATEGIMWINIDYEIKQTNSRSNMVYPFYLKEANI